MRASHASHMPGSESVAWANSFAAACALLLAISPFTETPDARRPLAKALRAASVAVAPTLVMVILSPRVAEFRRLSGLA